MAKSTGIVLTAGGISFANDWIQTSTPNIRIGVATLAVALIFDGIERLNERAGVGLSVIMLITVLLTPMHGKTPLETLGMVDQPSQPVKGKTK
jgi:hypothetical protein